MLSAQSDRRAPREKAYETLSTFEEPSRSKDQSDFLPVALDCRDPGCGEYIEEGEDHLAHVTRGLEVEEIAGMPQSRELVAGA